MNYRRPRRLTILLFSNKYCGNKTLYLPFQPFMKRLKRHRIYTIKRDRINSNWVSTIRNVSNFFFLRNIFFSHTIYHFVKIYLRPIDNLLLNIWKVMAPDAKIIEIIRLNYIPTFVSILQFLTRNRINNFDVFTLNSFSRNKNIKINYEIILLYFTRDQIKIWICARCKFFFGEERGNVGSR